MSNTLKVCWMYPEVLDLYGDNGNMMVLHKLCKERGIEFILTTCSLGEEIDLSDYDLLYLGGGDAHEQLSIIPDLLSRKENIQKAMNENTFVFLNGDSYQLFGQYFITEDSQKVDGLQIYDYYTDLGTDKERCVGNIVIDADLDGMHTKIVGFENHSGQTKNVSKPLGRVLSGYGNSFEAGSEGFYDGKVLGTYMHGPLFPKNSVLADFVISKALQKRNPEFKYSDLKAFKNKFEDDARAVMFKRLDINN